jgi:DNA-binding response OmpR family regulator
MLLPVSILIYGRDPDLLVTRQLVLQACGYRVCVTSDIKSILKDIELCNVDLLILCHSLSMEECGRMIALTSSLWPAVKILILKAVAASSNTQMLEDVIETMDETSNLIPLADRTVHHERNHTHA